MTSKFTQGEWEMGGKVVYAPDGSILCQVMRADFDEALANVRLIVNAPQMYEALKALASQEDWEGEDIPANSPVGKAWAVLAAIDGKE
jgi:hypothetical protein